MGLDFCSSFDIKGLTFIKQNADRHFMTKMLAGQSLDLHYYNERCQNFIVKFVASVGDSLIQFDINGLTFGKQAF
jgi:hypothetical protein